MENFYKHDEEVVRRVFKGETFTEIGKKLGLSRERVRQIAWRNGLTALDWRSERGAEQHRTRARENAKKLLKRRAAVRKRQRDRRAYLVACTKELAANGYVPSSRDLLNRTGLHSSSIARYFVGSLRGKWAQRGFARLYRLAGVPRRSPGPAGWSTR